MVSSLSRQTDVLLTSLSSPLTVPPEAGEVGGVGGDVVL